MERPRSGAPGAPELSTIPISGRVIGGLLGRGQGKRLCRFSCFTLTTRSGRLVPAMSHERPSSGRAGGGGSTGVSLVAEVPPEPPASARPPPTTAWAVTCAPTGGLNDSILVLAADQP
jgi:hypothetical protein